MPKKPKATPEMIIKEVTREAILALNLVPEKDVLIDQVNPDWDGAPRIYILSEPTKPDSETQFGVIAAETLLKIAVIAKERQQTWDIIRAAVRAAYDKWTLMEQTPKSGLLSAVYAEHNISQIPERNEFHAYFSFKMLHK